MLRLDWTGLVLAAGRRLTRTEAGQLDALVRRRLAREPLQHLLGEVEWGGLSLLVSPAALIPRPETETLLLLSLANLEGLHTPQVLDVGTGGGALALGIRAARPDAAVTASDLSDEALTLARRNAVQTGLKVRFVYSDLLHNVAGRFHLIVSNPPYLPEADRQEAQPEVKRDPDLALYSGPDGLDLARRLVAQVPPHLEAGGTLLLELDPRNVRVLAAEMTAAGWTVQVHPDLSGRERFLWARREHGPQLCSPLPWWERGVRENRTPPDSAAGVSAGAVVPGGDTVEHDHHRTPLP